MSMVYFSFYCMYLLIDVGYNTPKVLDLPVWHGFEQNDGTVAPSAETGAGVPSRSRSSLRPNRPHHYLLQEQWQ